MKEEENKDKNKDKNNEKIEEKNKDIKKYNEDEERPLKRTRRNSVITENDIPKIKPVCPGCFPIFQENQLGHYGPNGCLGDEFTLDDPSK
jgi:hypothetical protein